MIKGNENYSGPIVKSFYMIKRVRVIPVPSNKPKKETYR